MKKDKKFNIFKNSFEVNKKKVKKPINMTTKRNTNLKNKENFRIKTKSKTVFNPLIKYVKLYSYKIDKGNNYTFINELMEQRKGFTNNNDSPFFTNLLWTQGSKKFNFDKLEINKIQKICFNYFEFHNEITNKINLNNNLTIYCEKNLIDHNTFTPVTYSFDMNSIYFEEEIQGFIRLFKFNDLSIRNEFHFDFKILNKLDKFKLKSNYKKLSSKIEINIENFYNNIREKKNKFLKKINIKRIKNDRNNSIKYKEFNKIKLFHYYFNNLNLPSIRNISPILYINNFDKIPEYSRCFNQGKNLWIFKLSDYNRGIGVEVFNTLDGLNDLLIKYSKNNPNEYYSTKKTFIIQKYIEKPLWIMNKKFDIRVWALLDQESNLYIYQEGYLRLSSIDYNINTNERYIHLTNDAVQKKHEFYGADTDKNKLSFRDFEKYIKSCFKDDFNFEKEIFIKIKKIVQLSFHMIKYKINRNNRKNSFQLFGFDFMIDNDLNIWLIEINSNPCWLFSGNYLTILIKRMLNDCFKITIDKIFSTSFKSKLTYPLLDYDDEKNLFNYLMNLNKDNFNL